MVYYHCPLANRPAAAAPAEEPAVECPYTGELIHYLANKPCGHATVCGCTVMLSGSEEYCPNCAQGLCCS